MRLPFAFACIIAVVASPAPSQELVWRTPGVTGRQIGGFRTIAVGDVNQDGFEDILTIVHGECFGPTGTGTNGSRGYLWLLSGRNGAFIREMPSLGFGSPFTAIAAAGDMNGDSVSDYVASQQDPLSSVTQVRSGVDDSVLWSVPWSWDQVLSDLDIDGDGRNDLVVGDWHANNWRGEVRVYGHGGSLRYRLLGDASLALANSFAKLGDVDDDGCDDFAMACGEPSYRGATVVVSGLTGSYLRICYGELPGDGVGYIVDSCGDLDGDGYRDFVTGNGGGYFPPRGVIRAFSSRTGQVLYQWIGPAGIDYSRALTSRGIDLDGDALPDIVTGAPWEWFSATSPLGAVYAYSGRDGSQVHGLRSAWPGSIFGYWMTLLHPPPGDHTGLLIVPDNNANWTSYTTQWGNCAYSMGSISCYRGTPRTAQILGPSCSGTLPSAPDVGMQSLDANGVRVHVSRAPPSAPAVLVLGLSTTQYPGGSLPASLNSYGFPGCLLRTSIEATFLVVTGASGNDAGYARIDLPHPIPASGQGIMTLSAQWVVLATGSSFPGGVTQAITWRR